MQDENNQRQPDWRDVNLAAYTNTWWEPGRSKWWIYLWRLTGFWIIKVIPCEVMFDGYLNRFKCWLLRRFGAKLGKNIVLRACEIYYPWNLEIGDNCWIGYESNFYSLVPIKIGANATVSQRAFLCVGGHDTTEVGFGLIVGPITVKDGAWVGAGTFVGPGVTLHEGAVAAAGSVVVKDIPSMEIWGGNPCKKIKDRQINLDGVPPRAPSLSKFSPEVLARGESQ